MVPGCAPDGNTGGGPEHNERAEILDEKGKVIPNLYGAGEMGAFNAYMYQAGSNVVKCFIYGHNALKRCAELMLLSNMSAICLCTVFM